MIDMQREVTTMAPPAAVFDYLADFRTTEQWDPGTVRTVRVEGDGGVGTRYANTSEFLGRTSDVTYEVIDLVPGTSIRLRGENHALIAHDTITVSPHGGGSLVTYRVQFDFQGSLRWAEPLLRLGVRRLLDKGAHSMGRELARL
ncbi:SRPBCC family protein [Gordonia alkaliphila]|uniref:SRPBCC family protein n=1 Tax=Gordonia alkaliphila TaxID=1053547 RepID=A0ABP8Z7S6_9ACTN